MIASVPGLLLAGWLATGSWPVTTGIAQQIPMPSWDGGVGDASPVIPDVPLKRRPEKLSVPWSMMVTTAVTVAVLVAAVGVVVLADRLADRRRRRAPRSILPRRPP